MRLYKMELYKLCHRKIFMIGAVCTIILLILFFLTRIEEETAYVDGVIYQGYRAIQINRQITEEFKGLLTDEKVKKIIEKYGFPQKVEMYYAYYYDANFLNGWIAFFEVSVIGLTIGCILIIFSISIIFANESQSKMLQLLFTTKEGKKKDIYVKIAAAYTVAIGVWFSIVVIDFLLCGMVYGFDGLNCMIGTTDGMGISAYRPLSMLSVGTFLVMVLFRSLLGILLLCSITICISACFQSCFHAVVNAALCWMAPVLGWILIVNIQAGIIFRAIKSIIICLIYASPIYLIRFDSIMDCYRIWKILAGVSAVGIIFCTVKAYRKYKGQQAG